MLGVCSQALLEDRALGKLSTGGGGGSAVRARLPTGVASRVLDFEAWRRIDAIERERGAAVGKLREKMIDVHEMIAAGLG